MVATEMAPSKGAARRLIEQNAISINGEKVKDTEIKLNEKSLVKKGKNVFGIFLP
jgi:tyrosyl-tRNA synthetase